MFQSIKPRGVDRDELRVLAERRPRTRREILQARADREDHVGLGGERIGGGRADDADRACMRRVIVRKPALAGNRLDNRNAVLDRELGYGLFSQRIAHTAAGDQNRLLRGLEQRHSFGELLAVGARARHAPCARLEEDRRVVEGDFLDVLRKGEKRRPAIGGIEHRGHRLRERREDLRRMRDAVPIPSHRLERIIHRDGGIVEMFDLLEDGVRQPVREGVAGNQQHRKTVRMRRSRRRHHVQRAGAD